MDPENICLLMSALGAFLTGLEIVGNWLIIKTASQNQKIILQPHVNFCKRINFKNGPLSPQTCPVTCQFWSSPLSNDKKKISRSNIHQVQNWIPKAFCLVWSSEANFRLSTWHLFDTFGKEMNKVQCGRHSESENQFPLLSSRHSKDLFVKLGQLKNAKCNFRI